MCISSHHTVWNLISLMTYPHLQLLSELDCKTVTGLRYFMKFHGYCGTVLLWLWCICSLFLVHQLCMFEQDNCCCCRHTKSAVNVICEISGGWCWLRGCGASVQDIGSLHFILLTTALDNYWQHICWLRAGSWICLNVDNYHSLIKDSSPI